MQSQEPPAPDGDPTSADVHARHRRRRTDPPVPPDGAPPVGREPRPRTVAEYVSRRGGGAVHPTAPPPPWAHDRADPDGRLEQARTAQDDADARSSGFTGSPDDPPPAWPPPARGTARQHGPTRRPSSIQPPSAAWVVPAARPGSPGADERPPAATPANGTEPGPAEGRGSMPEHGPAAGPLDPPRSAPETGRADGPGDATASSTFAGPASGGATHPADAPDTDVAHSPDLALAPVQRGALAGRATAWFDDRGTASPATGLPGVPPPAERGSGWSPTARRTPAAPAGAGDRSSATPDETGQEPDAGSGRAGTEDPAATMRVRGAPPPGGDEPGVPPPQPLPRPRPSPSPRRFAPDVVAPVEVPGPPRPPAHPSPTEPDGHGTAAPNPSAPGDGPARTGADGHETPGGTPAHGVADPPHAGGTAAAAGHRGARSVVAETSLETTGPVLDRPLSHEEPSGLGRGAAAEDEPGGTGPRPVAHSSARTGATPGTDARPTDADHGAELLEPAPRRRRTLRPDPDHARTVSDVARERGLPVRAPAAAPGTGHGHGHDPATPAGKRVRILLAALLVPCALAALAGVALLWPGASPVPAVPPQQQVHGTVQAVQAADCTPGSGSGGCSGVTIRMADGPRSGRDLVQLVPAEPSTPRFAVGDAVVLGYSGGNPDQAGSYQITDFQRGMPLVWLAAAFAAAVLILGRWRGLAALVALGLSFAVLVLFVLPSILSGNSPLAVAVTGAGVIMFVVLYLSHGLSARTSCAVLGTLVSLALIGGLGALFTATTRLTGLDDTTSNLIGTLGGVQIDARGLVLAGLVIGALGVLDDVTVTQASAVWELRDANPALGAGKLFAAGMRIGRDHVSSAVNTLVLAYAGAALPLMLLFTVSSASFGQVVTSQDVATEIVRTLVGSIGLVASVPLTTGLAAVVAARR